MASEAQVSANRRNAGKSTGPRTTQGKAAVAQNAIKHGLLARRNLITGEDPQEFDLLRQEILGELTPVGRMETVLAERVVSLTWRIQRAERLQNEVFEYLLARDLEDSMEDFYEELSPEDEARLTSDPETDPNLAVGRAIMRDYSNEKVLDRLGMYERRIEGSLYRTMKELQNRRLLRKPGPADGGLADESPASQAPMADCAKQSQSEEVSSVKCRVSSEAGPAPADEPACKTNPICGGQHNEIPAGRDVVTVSAKQSQFPEADASLPSALLGHET